MDKIHYTHLPSREDDSEWETYRREVGRLLKEGQEGKWILIKGSTIVGIWETKETATEEAFRRFLLQPVLVHEIREWEPLIRGPLSVRVCPS